MSTQSKSKLQTGNFFEDFRVGQEFRHATPRTLTEADAALNVGLYGSRFAVNSSDVFARAIGFPRAPLDDMLVFHVVIGKTVNDISLNAVANLGYDEFRFGVPVFPGDTLSVSSTVLGLRENSNRASGVVWVRYEPQIEEPAVSIPTEGEMEMRDAQGVIGDFRAGTPELLRFGFALVCAKSAQIDDRHVEPQLG